MLQTYRLYKVDQDNQLEANELPQRLVLTHVPLKFVVECEKGANTNGDDNRVSNGDLMCSA